MKRIALALLVSTLVGTTCCAPTAPLVLSPEAERIEVGQSDPGPGFHVIRGIDAVDGNGCGAFGTRGTFNGALSRLRYEAGQLHAGYVKIISTREPYGDGNCFHNEYSISAIAYGKSPTTETP